MVHYTRADQFPKFLSKRLAITTLLARCTFSYRFVWPPGPASVYVSGAAVQVDTGSSQAPAGGERRCCLRQAGCIPYAPGPIWSQWHCTRRSVSNRFDDWDP